MSQEKLDSPAPTQLHSLPADSKRVQSKYGRDDGEYLVLQVLDIVERERMKLMYLVFACMPLQVGLLGSMR
jgi:hypothetical protein